MSLDMGERPRTPIDSRTDASMRTARGLGKLQALLEQECEAQVGTGCAAAAVRHHEHVDEDVLSIGLTCAWASRRPATSAFCLLGPATDGTRHALSAEDGPAMLWAQKSS